MAINSREERDAAFESAKLAQAKLIKGIVTKVIVGLLATFAFFSSCTNVPTGNVGVVKHFGAIQDYTLPEGGPHFLRPWPMAEMIPVTIQNNTTEAEAAGASKDLQVVHTKVAVNWSIAPHRAAQLVQKFGYCDGCWTGGIVSPGIQEVVKSVSARYTAEQLITERGHVKNEIEQGLKDFIGKTLKGRGCDGAIRIANLAVTNFEFSGDFNKSIEAKVKALQDSLRAENEKKTRITQAEAAAQEQKLNADATAYKTEVESKARAAAIERESKALEQTPNLIQLRIAERWDGKLPTYTGNSIPLLQVK